MNSFEKKNTGGTPHKETKQVPNKEPDSKTGLVIDDQGNIVSLDQILSGEHQ